MFKKLVITCFTLTSMYLSYAQKAVTDTTTHPITANKDKEEDIDYDQLFNELSFFLDSLLMPRSYTLVSMGVSNNSYSFVTNNSTLIKNASKITLLPTLGYYHKGGLGITASANVIQENKKLNAYQYVITPSFDYIKNMDFATGFSFTRYITKDSLSFYTSPLKNELTTYFTYRNWWLKPTAVLSYGWGQRSDFEEREDFITSLRLLRRGYTTINTTESVSDLSLVTSVSHDFYWLQVLTAKDHIRLSPQINLNSGTQRFGFNQTYNSYLVTRQKNTDPLLRNTENVELNDHSSFKPQAISVFLRGEYGLGKAFLQPSFLVGYFFNNNEKPLNTMFAINAGFMF